MKPAIVVLLSSLLLPVWGGELDPSQQDWYEHYEKQENIPAFDEMLLNTDPEPDLTGEFVELFNGKDLDGWTPRGGTCEFEVIDSEIVGTCVKGSPSTYLSTDRADFTDFVFTCEMKWEVDGNTGVMFRADSKPGKKGGETVFGPQAEMEDEGKDRGWSGGIYGQSAGGWFYPLWLKDHADARAARKAGEWNRVTIQAIGDEVKTWVNGVPAAHWVNGDYTEGFFSLQVHSGNQGKIRFRDLRVQELASRKVSLFSGEDLEGWSVPEGNEEAGWYQAIDGELRVQSGPKQKGSILWTQAEYEDFELECEFKLGKGTVDSGIHLRNEDQIQIGESGSLKRDMTGSPYIPGKGYPVEAKGVAELLKKKDWNTMRIKAIGNHYMVWLNGEHIVEYESDSAIEKGSVGIQLHGKRDMSIQFRGITLKEL